MPYSLETLNRAKAAFPHPHRKVFTAKDAEAVLGPVYELRKRGAQQRENTTSTWIDNDHDEDYVPEEEKPKRKRSASRPNRSSRARKRRRQASTRSSQPSGAAAQSSESPQTNQASSSANGEGEETEENEDDGPDAWDVYWAATDDWASPTGYNLRTRNRPSYVY
ncbi:hypothetical protein N7468_008546 [Penicillium chermesinum]|uniref:Uncharacterized protein n=1 Tax=Penicillium chermesinum TaxID=63820 RepID=A0A9W9NSS6_9EURO|nr:uncharacterized protein N7468_008546 [Penicillium chermesinum]KAJ5224004.1 hypothetical protein N7468_008546 [Penicillium chermesinum]